MAPQVPNNPEKVVRIGGPMALPGLPSQIEEAIKILVCLALSAPCAVPASTVAKCTHVPASQVSKILNYLTWRGMVRSRRGSKGGYYLAQSPDDIHVGQVIQLFRPAFKKPSGWPPDPLLRIWSETSAAAQQAWEQLSIAELARRTAGDWEHCFECKESGVPA